MDDKYEARFLSRVRKEETGCWIWTAGKTDTGYGYFWEGSTTRVAHRWWYERLHGGLADGLQLDHLCRNKACVNPDHLEPVSARENTRRAPSHNANKTHCPYGHEYTPENTLPRTRGRRECRKCNRRRSRERYSRLYSSKAKRE